MFNLMEIIITLNALAIGVLPWEAKLVLTMTSLFPAILYVAYFPTNIFLCKLNLMVLLVSLTWLWYHITIVSPLVK